LGACLVFLRLNGVEPKPDSVKWESLTFAIADARIDRDEATKQLRALLPKAKSPKKKRKRK
jgi:prophage maintenance system killer protein